MVRCFAFSELFMTSKDCDTARTPLEKNNKNVLKLMRNRCPVGLYSHSANEVITFFSDVGSELMKLVYLLY